MLVYPPMKCHDFLNQHCLSCELMSLDYEASITWKEQELKSLFPLHINQIKNSVINQDRTEESRNKAKFSVVLADQNIQFGFYDLNGKFKKLESCPLHAKPINKTLEEIKKLLLEYKIIPYDISTKKGELKYLLITYSESTNELLLRFVLRSKESLDRLKQLAKVLITNNELIKVVTANFQPVHQAILEGDEEIVLTERDFITHQFGDFCLFQGPRSFFQTNSKIAKELYLEFQSELQKIKPRTLLDLYCGVGAFSFFASSISDKITAVEISSEAIKYANIGKVKNELHNIDFKALDAEVFLDEQKEEFEVVLVNPPRRGLNTNIIAKLLKLSPQFIFYSSCNVNSLKNDWEELQNNYQINSLKLFDMFPHTKHYETLMILSKKGKKVI